MTEKSVRFIVNKETLAKSVLSDIFTVSIITGTLSASHILVGSAFLDGVLLFMLAFFIVGKAAISSDIETIRGSEKMLEYLIKNHPEHFTVTDKEDTQ